MPELAEVEYYRKVWDPGLGHRVKEVIVRPHVRCFRECDVRNLRCSLLGRILKSSESHGKRMLFRFSRDMWLGVHLGMTGKLHLESDGYLPDKHAHFVIVQAKQRLVFSDFRQFGKILLSIGRKTPEWWSNLPPALVSDGFTRDLLRDFLKRHGRSPIKSVLLLQAGFPGIGNWMADEILWRARIRPDCMAARVDGVKLSQLYSSIGQVCRDALDVVGTDWNDPPDSWLFNHRWKDGGRCPKTGRPLQRLKIGGRTTCWSPAWQRWPIALPG